jgi:peptide/nickel transport system permease protein
MRLIFRRLILYIVTAIVAITVNFFIPHLMPGNPVLTLIGRMQAQISTQTINALELQYGVNTKTGLWGQYVHYWNELLHGNLGTSLSSYPTPVATLIRGALPWTIGLVGTATVLSFVLGTLIGIAAAWRRGSWLDSLLPAMTFFQAVPYFFLAILAVALFGTKFGWFPQNSAYDITLNPGFSQAYISSVLDHAVLPALTIVLASIAGWTITMRNVMITTMDEDYVLIAQAKGLPSRRVVTYAARNAILPSVSGFSLAVGFIVSGALLTEIVFSYPGIGFILLQAISNQDYPLLQGIFLVITFAVLAANLIADFVYAFLDPRTRQEA